MKNFLFITSTILFLIILTFVGLNIKNTLDQQTYWGNNILGNGFWLIPNNNNVAALIKRERISGTIQNLISNDLNSLKVNIADSNDKSNNQTFELTIPKQIAKDKATQLTFLNSVSNNQPLDISRVIPILSEQNNEIIIELTTNYLYSNDYNYIAFFALLKM